MLYNLQVLYEVAPNPEGHLSVTLRWAREIPGVRIADLVGEVTIDNVDALRNGVFHYLLDRLDQQNDVEPILHLILNLAELHYMDTVRLGVVLVGVRRLREQGVLSVSVCRANPQVLRAFGLVGMERIVPVYATEEEATAAAIATGFI